MTPSLWGQPPRQPLLAQAHYSIYLEWRRRGEEAHVEAETSFNANAIGKDTPEEQIENSHKALTAALQLDLLDRVREMSPGFFENLIVDLMIAMDYGGGRAEMGKAIGRSGDGGIDGIIKEDALGLDIVYIQAKRYASDHAVSRQEVQSFAGSLDGVGATKVIFVATSSFTRSAREFVIAKRIILVDGEELARLMVRNNVGVRVRTSYDVKKVDEDYFSE